MIGDAAHKRLLDDGRTWNGCEVYTKILGKGAMAGQSLELRGQHRSGAENIEESIKFARTHSWDLYLMNSETAWVPICIQGSFWEAAKAVLGIKFRGP